MGTGMMQRAARDGRMGAKLKDHLERALILLLLRLRRLIRFFFHLSLMVLLGQREAG